MLWMTFLHRKPRFMLKTHQHRWLQHYLQTVNTSNLMQLPPVDNQSKLIKLRILRLVSKLPNNQLSVIINSLQNKLYLRQNLPISNHSSKTGQIPKPLDFQFLKLKQDRNLEKQRFFCYSPIQPKFEKKEEKLDFQQKVAVARAFCEKDYGKKHLFELLQENKSSLKIPSRRYHEFSSSVALRTFRRLQMFLQQQCLVQVQLASRMQVVALTQVLHLCRNYLHPYLCETFLKFVRLTFCLNTKIIISHQEAIELHQSLLTWVSKQQPKRSNRVSSKNRLKKLRFEKEDKDQELKSSIASSNQQSDRNTSTSEGQRFMLSKYKEFPSLDHIYRMLLQKHPNEVQGLPLTQFKYKFQRILRQSFKRARKICKTEPVAEAELLLGLGLQTVQSLFSHQLAIKIHFLLIDLWFQRISHSKKAIEITHELVKEIQLYLAARKQQFESQRLVPFEHSYSEQSQQNFLM